MAGKPDKARMAELQARVAASRAAQGLPPYVTDEVTLAKVADLIAVFQNRSPAPLSPIDADGGAR